MDTLLLSKQNRKLDILLPHWSFLWCFIEFGLVVSEMFFKQLLTDVQTYKRMTNKDRSEK